uniref:Eukaryotic translation initiation factor 3 subunit C n=1 Tax=Ditylenchus dipsaci TaxID=166011 RepID=A0A915DJB0_9BILA
MSKFFKGAVSSSESSDSEESGDETGVIQQRPVVRDFGLPSDSDDEGPKRVVRSQKDKMYQDLKEQIRVARNARNIKDVTKLLTAFENLCKVYDKTKSVISKEGLTIPRFYIRYLAEVEDFCSEQWADKDGIKAMSKANSKSFNSLRQKLRKYTKDFETEILAYRDGGADPAGYSSGVNESDGGEAEENKLPDVSAAQSVKKKEVKAKKFNAESDAESDSEWDDDLGSSSGSEIELEGKQMEDLRKFFLKKEKTVKVKEKEVRKNKEAKAAKDVESDVDESNSQWMKICHRDDPSKPLFESKAEINAEVVIKKLAEVNRDRGKKGTNRKIHLKYLQELYDITVEHNLGMGILAKILSSVISAQFEMNARISDSMEFKSWMKTLETIDGLFSMLTEHQNVHISISTNEDEENLTDPSVPFRIHGSAVLLVKRLDDELTKIFQHTDCHSTDYIEKLKGEKELCTLISKAQSYVDIRRKSGILEPNEAVIIYMLNIEHLYYKYSPDELETEQLMDRLCKVIYSMDNNTMQQRQRAMLCQIYHHALHDRFHKAKNLMLMSHLQAIADHSDANTQVLYNRTICQLGLAAFRNGSIREAHLGLHEIQNTQKAKELLAQGVPPRNADKTPEQEIKERAVQVPYHMHINLELMECVYLICCMLLEIPNIGHEGDMRRRMLSRSFHYQLKFSEKSALIGPPENTREHVVAASRAMLRGDWNKCRDYIINDKMNAKVWNLFRNSEKVKNMVMSRIQEETLRTYLLMYSTVYTTVSLETLCELFDLEKKRVYSLISKMIINEELSATLDEPTDCLIMHRVEPSRLQQLALNMTDKLTQLADSNEQIIDPRSARAGYAGPGGNWGYQSGNRQRAGDSIQNSDNRSGRAVAVGAWGQRRGGAVDRNNRTAKFPQSKGKQPY